MTDDGTKTRQPDLFDRPTVPCRFCGGVDAPNHWLTCDGRQGKVEAMHAAREPIPAPLSPAANFDGTTYVRPRDHDRLFAQLEQVRTAMGDETWHTLGDLEQRCGAPQASISARLRDLRKPKFGGHQVERRYVAAGLWEYRLVQHREAS